MPNEDTEEILYKVGVDGRMRSFTIALSHGTYANLMDNESGEYLTMENRHKYRDTELGAWMVYTAVLGRMIEHTKAMAIKSQQKLAVLGRINVMYKEKQSDLAEAMRLADYWINELLQFYKKLKLANEKINE